MIWFKGISFLHYWYWTNVILQQTSYVWDLQWDSFAIGNWFCGLTQLFYKQDGHCTGQQAQQADTICWKMGTRELERQRRNVEGKRKGREEEWNRVLWGKSVRVNSGWEVVRFFRFLVWKINQWQALPLRTSRLPPMWPHWAFSRHCG